MEGVMDYGWWSVVPPLVAIVLAMLTRRVVPALAFGVLVGAVLLDPNWAALSADPPAGAALWKVPWSAGASFFEEHLWTSLSDAQHLRVFAFTLLMGAMIGVIHRGGGMHAVVRGLAPLASSRRGGQLMTWVLGLIVFIDDYANSLLLGHTMRPLADRLGISREKLAYLVDCTAAPVSGLALISTWVAGEIGYIEAGYESLPLEDAPSGMAVFIESIPYRFYVIWALLFVPVVALLGRDFGPMWTAERDARRDQPSERDARRDQPSERDARRDQSSERDARRDQPSERDARRDQPSERSPDPSATGPASGPARDPANHSEPPDDGEAADDVAADGEADGGAADDPAALANIPHRWYNAVVPILVALGVTIALLAATGYRSVDAESLRGTWWQRAIAVIGNADSYVALVYGSLSGLLAAGLLVRSQGLLSAGQLRKAAWDGARLVLPSLTILWLAWALSGTTDEQHLGTGQFLGGLLRDPQPPAWLPETLRQLIEQALAPRWMPTIVFLLASFVAFSTGTSWGTMGILMPIVVATTFEMLAADGGLADPRHPLLIATIGSVLAGAIFGDHCSPISDTTVLSAQASGCDHLRHVRTQLPYALLVAAVAVLLGTIPVGLGLPVWPLLPVGLAALAGLLYLLGRRV